MRSYGINPAGQERISDEVVFSFELTGRNFYTEKSEAETASKFLEVDVDEETWKLAIGEREVTGPDSPHCIDNCDLMPCCANISEARDILYLCRNQNGLLLHNVKELVDHINYCGSVPYDPDNHLGKIFKLLEVDESAFREG